MDDLISKQDKINEIKQSVIKGNLEYEDAINQIREVQNRFRNGENERKYNNG